MNDLITPDWVAREAEDLRNREYERENEKLQRLLLQKADKADGPEYRKELAKEIAIGAESCAVLGITGTAESISEQVGETPKTAGVRFTLTLRGIPNRSRSTNVYIRDNELVVRCFSEAEEEEKLYFCVSDSGDLRLRINGSLLSSKEAAAFIVRREYKRLNG